METIFVYERKNERERPPAALDLFYLAVDDYRSKCGQLPGRVIMHADWREQMQGALGIDFGGDEVEVVYRPDGSADDRWLVRCDGLMTSLAPWRADGETSRTLYAADGQAIFSVSPHAYPGDILLAAAAPDLYQALQLAVEFLEQCLDSAQVFGIDPVRPQAAAAIVSQATQALARSRGQRPLE